MDKKGCTAAGEMSKGGKRCKTALQTTMKRGGEEVLQVPKQSPLKEIMVRQAVPPHAMKDHGGADTHLQPMGDPVPHQVEMP